MNKGLIIALACLPTLSILVAVLWPKDRRWKRRKYTLVDLMLKNKHKRPPASPVKSRDYYLGQYNPLTDPYAGEYKFNKLDFLLKMRYDYTQQALRTAVEASKQPSHWIPDHNNLDSITKNVIKQ